MAAPMIPANNRLPIPYPSSLAIIPPIPKTVLTLRRIELAVDRLAILPGPLHERLAGLCATLGALSASDFPTLRLGTQWEAIRAALFLFDTGQAPSDDTASEIARAFLDLRAELRTLVRYWVELGDWPTDKS